MKITKNMERWSPLVLLLAVLVLWQLIVMIFRIPDFIFPSPTQIASQFFEFSGPLLEAAWRRWNPSWKTCCACWAPSAGTCW